MCAQARLALNRSESERGSRAPRRLQTCLMSKNRSAGSRRVNTAVSLKSSRRNGNTLSQLAADPFKRISRRSWPAVTFAVRDESLRILAETSRSNLNKSGRIRRQSKAKSRGFTYVFLLDDIPLRSFLAHYAIPKTMFGYKENGHMNFFLLIPRRSRSTDKRRLNPRLRKGRARWLRGILRGRSTSNVRYKSQKNVRNQGSRDSDGPNPNSLGDNIVKTNAQQ